MNFDPILLSARKDEMKTKGFWRDETINDFFISALHRCPDKQAVVAYKNGIYEPIRLTYRVLDKLVENIAQGLVNLGIKPSDVITFQLPNCWEFIAISLACARIGAVANPVMPIFRQHELNFILNFSESKIFIVAKEFRNHNYEKMAEGMLDKLPLLQNLIVIDGEGDNSFEKMLLTARAPSTETQSIAPDDVALLMYTSGTTGEPKGVMHTSNTLFSNLLAYIDVMELNDQDITLGASPMAHLTGYGYLAMIPIILSSTTVLMDVWNADKALQIIKDEGVTFSMASATFVADLCEAVDKGIAPAQTLTKFNCAGAPIPPILIERAYQLMELTICSAWGMTECGAVTVTAPDKAMDKSGISDGHPLPGIEIQITDSSGNILPTNETGNLQIRGASLFAGYLKRPQLNDVNKEGWYKTGDLAYRDNDGFIRITGRSKDVVMRGGENIPIIEIENILYQHPLITHVAIVGYPDERLGERVCAFVTTRPGETLSFNAMIEYLTEKQISKTYFPERLEILEEMPQTPSGKLQKFKLREMASNLIISN